uniref:Uncharacterized protein n=1 Tax=Anguilla anguilla TaxID=7936 RepID=A0A0E9RLW7_ANGAN
MNTSQQFDKRWCALCVRQKLIEETTKIFKIAYQFSKSFLIFILHYTILHSNKNFSINLNAISTFK